MTEPEPDRPATHLFARPAAGAPEAATPGPVASGDDVPDISTGRPTAEDVPATPTGDHRVDEAMATLAGLTDRPAAEQVVGYEAIHRALQDTLATVDDA